MSKNRSDHQAIRLQVFVVVITLAASVFSQSPCPECMSDQPVNAGHGAASSLPQQSGCNCANDINCPGCQSDNRRVITVRIDGSWNSPAGQTNAAMYNAVQCALRQWNTTRGTTGHTTGYYFYLDQSGSVTAQADIVIIQGTPSNSPFANITPGSPPHTMTVASAIANLPAADSCGTVAHEIGHPIGLANEGGGCFTIMTGNNANGTRWDNTVMPGDIDRVNQQFDGNTRPSCTRTIATGNAPLVCNDSDQDGVTDCEADCTNGGGHWVDEQCLYSQNPGCEPGDWGFVHNEGDCNGLYNPNNCTCAEGGGGGGGVYTPDPVLLDPDGDGFQLTSRANGVLFDLDADGDRERTPWTAATSDDAWLALDRDGDGRITSGAELFGHHTPGSGGAAEGHGYIALAVFDANSDGQMTAADPVFANLRLWRDASHDGVSQAAELTPLSSSSITGLDLDFKESRKTDEFGNEFRFRAKVERAGGGKRWSVDVFLTAQ